MKEKKKGGRRGNHSNRLPRGQLLVSKYFGGGGRPLQYKRRNEHCSTAWCLKRQKTGREGKLYQFYKKSATWENRSRGLVSRGNENKRVSPAILRCGGFELRKGKNVRRKGTLPGPRSANYSIELEESAKLLSSSLSLL